MRSHFVQLEGFPYYDPYYNAGFDPPQQCELDISRLATDIHDYPIIGLGPIKKQLIKECQIMRFSHIPVETPNMGIGMRLISTAHLRELVKRKRPLVESEEHFIPNDACVLFERNAGPPIMISLPNILSALIERPAFIIYTHSHYVNVAAKNEISASSALDKFRGEEPNMPEGDYYYIHGLLSIEDINKPIIRRIIYDIILNIEMDLAQLLIDLYNNPMDWIRLLPEEVQARTIGYWQLSKARGIPANAAASLSLGHLLDVVSKTVGMLSLLNYESRNAFKKTTGSLPDLRNRTMHPVRPLVVACDDLAKVKAAVESAIDLQTKCAIATRRQRHQKRNR